MPQCGLTLSYFLVEPRQVVVGVRELFVQCDCPAVGCDRGIGALQIFEGGAEVEGGGCVLRGEPKRFLILENGFLHPSSLLEQPAEVDMRVGVPRVERQRTAIRIFRIAGLDRLEFLLVITDYEGGIIGPIETQVPCEPTDGGTLPDSDQPCASGVPSPGPSAAP